MLVREMPKEHAPPEMQWQKNRRTNCYRIRIVSVFELNIQSTYSKYLYLHPMPSMTGGADYSKRSARERKDINFINQSCRIKRVEEE